MTKTFSIEESIAEAKREIREGIAEGFFPSTLSSFHELNEYCDANELGGLCDDSVMDTLTDEEFFTVGKVVQAQLNKWIIDGMK